MRSPRYRARNVGVAILVVASTGWGYESASALSATPRDETLSFDMWCLEMKLYPSQRCDLRRSDDLRAFEKYRTEVENFNQTRTTREQRDLQLQKKLNQDAAAPTNLPGPPSR